MLDAAVVYDVETGKRVRWLAGPPRGRFVFDRHLVVVAGDGTTGWDLETGDHVHDAPGFAPIAFHPTTRLHLSTASDGNGNDFVISTLLE